MRWASLSLLVLVACGGEKSSFLTVFDPCEPLTLEPAADASEQQQASVREAADMWNAVAATGLTLEPGGRALPIVFEDSYLFLGFYDDSAEVIRLARRVDERRPMAVVLAHELGHAFNLFHVSDRDSVMNEGNWEIAPLPSDAAALEAEWGPCVHR
jgi:hypothetical protein